MNACIPSIGTLSQRPNTPTLSFISLKQNVPFKPLSLSLSCAPNTSKRRSCFIKPSESPTITNRRSITNFPDDLKKSSIFSTKSTGRSLFQKALPPRSSLKSLSTDKQSQDKISLDDAKPLLRKKSRHDSLRKTIVGLTARPLHVEEGPAHNATSLDDSFCSMSSDRSRSYRRGLSSHVSPRTSVQSRQKTGKAEEPNRTPRLGQIIRRKSCHCSDCGGLSKKEKMYLNIVEPCPRVLKNKTKVFFRFLSQDSRDFSNGATPKTSKSMNRTSFSSRNTPKSMCGFSPSGGKIFKQLQTLSSFGGPESKPYRPLSRFATRGDKCTTVQVFHDETAKDNLCETRIDKLSMRETELELQGSLVRASIEELNHVQRNNATYISSLDLDVQKVGEKKKLKLDTKGDEELQATKLKKKSSLNQEKRSFFVDMKKIASQEPKTERLRTNWPNPMGLNGKLISPKGNNNSSTSDIRALQKLKETRIQEIYTTKQIPFLNGKQKGLSWSQSCRIVNSRAKEEKIQTNKPEMGEIPPKSLPNKRASLPMQSTQALQNMLNRNNEGFEKKTCRNKSLSFRKSSDRLEKKNEEIKRLLTSYGENMGYKILNENNLERVILKSSNGKRSFRTFAVGGF